MMRRSPRSWLVLLIGMSGCATPGLTEPMTTLPYPAMTMSTLQQTNICQGVEWGGPAAAYRTVAYTGEAPAAVAPGTVATMPQGDPGMSDPCAPTRGATKPVRRFLHAVFFPDSPSRLTPMPVPAEATAAAQAPAIMAGYHLKQSPVARSGEIIPAEQLALPVDLAASSTGPALAGPSVPEGHGEILQTSFAVPVTTPNRAESIAPEMPLSLPPPRPAEAAADAPPGPPVHVVSERSIRLNCKLRDVGPSGLSAVEVWYTQDGRRWQKAEHNCPPQPPYVMDVKEDGRYGITLIARNGLGIARTAPTLGEAPQVWVEVDTTRPSVQVGKAIFFGDESSRGLAITWSATDKNLGTKPIQLAFAEKPQGPWTVIGDVENTGSYQWRPSVKLPASFFVRVQATDKAGNTMSAVATEPVVLDLSRPSVEILSVESYKRK